jgi:hypothetical protein
VQAPLTIDSSLITGAMFGIDHRAGDRAGTDLLLRASTIDPGARGADPAPNPEGLPISAVALGGGQGLVESSIVFDALNSWDDGDGELRCEYSAVTHTVQERVADEHGAVACPSGSQGNIPVSAALVGAGYALTAASAARDAGRPGAPAADASATDAAGRPRIARPAGCDGRIDMGAFETDARPCPPVPVPPPATCTSAAPPCVPAPPASEDRTAPRLSQLSRKRGRLRGTLSERATVRVTIKRCVPARGGRGAATSRGKARCVVVARRERTRAAGRFTLALPAKARRAGRYRVAVTATDAAGNAATARLRFRVTR